MGRVIMLFGGFTALAAAAAAAVVAVGSMGSGSLGSMLGAAGTSGGTEEPVVAHAEATTARVLEIVRAAGGDPGTGVSVRAAGGSFAETQPDGVVPVGGTIRTDARTRVRLALSDGSELTLNHGTELSFDAEVPRRFRLASGELLADVEHMEDGPNASFTTPTGTVEVVGTKFDLTATDELASVRVTRGKVRVTNGSGTVEVDQGEEGVLRTAGAPVVTPAIDLARAVAWSDLGGDSGTAGIVPEEEVAIPGIGSLRARRPGEREDRERPLAVSSANVRIRISGNVARTEIEQVFQNDGAAELEGIYRFPLPADARIARLALDVNGELEEGAFVARNRARRIWTGVIRNATPVASRRPTEDFIWVPGPWRDPALLEWQRGGNFELRIYPIPAQGSRRVVLAYTQVVRPHGSERRYVYPLPVSRDGSTRIGELNVDVRINGAQAVRSSGYAVTQNADTSATTLSYQARDFVPNGDLVIDYALPGGEGELAYWAYQGDAAAAPPEHSRDRDREVVDAQRQIAADERGYVTFALRPRLPARTEGRTHDYVIVVDSSQSMVGERFTRASRLVTGLLAEMDRRDRFTVLACDYECRSMDGGAAVNASNAGNVRMHSPTSDEVRAAGEWLGQVEPAGASDLGASLRLAARAANQGTTDASREVHVLYVGDGVASVGHRAAGALAEEAEQVATRERVSITTVGIGGDADTVALGAIARAGGGHYVPFVPGERTSSTALAVLETTYGVSLEDATFELPEGLSDVAPTALPTIRAGEEVILSARLDRPSVSGDVIVRGTVGGETFEQRYPVTVEPSTSAGNLFVPAQWASSTIERLELEGRGEDEARIIALSKAYSVMSRHTSLLVLESESMFRAFGIDREEQQQAAWTGDEAAEGSISLGELGVESEADLLQGAFASSESAGEAADSAGILGGLSGHGRGGGGTGSGYGVGSSAGGARGRRSATLADSMDGDAPAGRFTRADRAAEPRAEATREQSAQQRPTTATSAAPPAAAAAPMAGAVPVIPQPRGPGQWMRRVWVRVGDVSNSNEITFREQEAARVAEQNLAAMPDSRDRHRLAVRALARAGNVSRALEVADAWISRDRTDPEALAARADLLARSGRRDEALRVLTGIVDLRPDDAVLQERLANAFERAGQSERSCSHRVAMAEIDTTNADRVGAAVRCERATGRSSMADVLLRSVREERTRERATRVAGEAATPLPSRGDLFLDASWSGGDDIDLTLIAPDGSRISWMGGRTNVVASAPMASGTETLGLRSATAGNYLIEVSRTSATDRRTITGSIRVRVLDATETIRFTLRGDREVVGRAIVRREQRMETVQGSGW
jgi:tetratricopeptide (TPR) repeat protein